ncbi:uncharacterized protein [Anolis sagrei]|uniref:uncharacterized protein n=1 Tax=Anolis sagrei TaxID=38937 RepID=UPI0035223C30
MWAQPDKDTCEQLTISLLNFLDKAGFKVSKKKAQICKDTVRYLGFDVSQGQRALGPETKEAICRVWEPKTKKQLRGFLGMAGFCRIWLPNFGPLARSLYEATSGPETFLVWSAECRTAFETIKKALMSAPALGLPDMTKPFYLRRL